MTREDPLLPKPAAESVRLVALRYLEEAAAAAERLRDPHDTEALHDFRVALRRLRSCMRAYREQLSDTVKKKPYRRVRDIAQATNEGRDAEVQLAWIARQRKGLASRERAGSRWLEERLQERREVAYAEVHHDVTPAFVRLHAELREALAHYDLRVRVGEEERAPTFGEVTAGLARGHVGELAAKLAAIESADDQTRVHEARIAAKRLRYLLEPLAAEQSGAGALVKQLKGLQDVLGELHDSHVLAAELEAAAAAATAQRAASHGLSALSSKARRESDRLYARFRRHWVGAKSAGFFSAARELADQLGGPAAPSDTEIERKYLLSAVPAAVAGAPWKDIDQGWIPGEKLHERLRRVRTPEGEKFYRTVKLGRGVRRVEIEEETAPEIFRKMWPLTKGKRVQKRRYEVREGELTWEIDVFRGRELVLAEVELSSESAAVEPPEWLAPHLVREVTDDSAYVNINLAR